VGKKKYEFSIPSVYGKLTNSQRERRSILKHLKDQAMKILKFLILIVILSGQALSKPRIYDCYTDSIWDSKRDGKILKMISGEIYRVSDYYSHITMLWLETTDVMICKTTADPQIYLIINTDDNESAPAKKLN
jgi:hypothetical protein